MYATRFQKSTAQERASSFWRLLYSVRAMLSFFWQFEKFGTGEGLLWYRKFTRCPKRLPGVRDAFSEAFGVKNRLFWYGRDIRYRKRPPTVRDAFSMARNSRLRRLWTAFCRSERIFKGAELPPAAPNASSAQKTAAPNAFWDVTD